MLWHQVTAANPLTHALCLRQVRIIDDTGADISADGTIGEVIIRGPTVFKGYWQQQQQATQAAFTDDGWFRTGRNNSLW